MRRYDVDECGRYPCERGDFCLWSDVELLQRERDEARALLWEILAEEVELDPSSHPFLCVEIARTRRFEVPLDICTRAEKITKVTP